MGWLFYLPKSGFGLPLRHLKGAVAERLGRALQKLPQRFESAQRLYFFIPKGSSFGYSVLCKLIKLSGQGFYNVF